MSEFNKKELTKEEKKQYKDLILNLSYFVNNFNNLEEKLIKEKIKGLSIIEIHLLDTISKNPMKTTTEIANKQNITVGALMTCLKKLYEKNYLERIEDEKDKRIVHLKVTELSKPILKIHEQIHTDFIDKLIKQTSFNSSCDVVANMVELLEAMKKR